MFSKKNNLLPSSPSATDTAPPAHSDRPRIMPRRSDRYLSDDDLVILTGRKNKRLQVDQLREMNIPFALNACREPIVPASYFQGGSLARAKAEVADVERRIDRALWRE